MGEGNGLCELRRGMLFAFGSRSGVVAAYFMQKDYNLVLYVMWCLLVSTPPAGSRYMMSTEASA
jgi:hypothetical protein